MTVAETGPIVDEMMYGVQLRRSMRRLRWVLRAWLRRAPALRRHSPLALSILLNVSLFALALMSAPPKEMKGTSRTAEAVTVFIVPPEPDPAPIEPDETEAAELEGKAPRTEVAREENVPLSPAERSAEAAPAPGGDVAPPRVRVPKVDEGRGVPDGIVAIDCDDWFEDRTRAAECAGREITSNWEKTLSGEESERWKEAAELLRRGRHRRETKGPDRFGDLAQDEELYEKEDPRFTPRAPMRRFAEAFETREEYERFLALQDPRLYIGNTELGPNHFGSSGDPLSGWRPSWQLREDPTVDAKTLDEFLKSVE